MSDLTHYEVRLVRAPKDKVWKTVSDLEKDFIDVQDIKVTGTGKGAQRTIDLGNDRLRVEKVLDLKEKESVILERKEGDKVEGRMELELEDHDLGTMVIHRAFLDVKGPIKSLTTKGKVKKELKQRVDGIKETVENGGTSSATPKATKKSAAKTAAKDTSKKSAAKEAKKDTKSSKGGKKAKKSS